MYRFIFLLLLLTLFFKACKNKSDEYTVYQFPEVIQVKGKAVGPQNLILKPYRLTKCGRFLILNDTAPNKTTNCMLYLYSIDENRVVKNFGSYGDGPEELKDVSDFYVDETRNEIVVYDQIRKNFLHYQLDSLLNFSKYKPRVVTAPLGMFSLYRFCMPNDTLYITNGEEKLFTFFTDKGSITFEKHEYPIVDYPVKGFNTNITGNRLRSMLIGQLAFDHINSNIIVAYFNFDLIEIYSINGDRQKHVKNPTYFAPYKEKGWYNYNSCYYDVKVLGDYIYALYSGYKLVRGDDKWKQGNTIQVFDLDLNPIRMYELDIPISSFEVDTVRRKIYAINTASVQPITVFNL